MLFIIYLTQINLRKIIRKNTNNRKGAYIRQTALSGQTGYIILDLTTF